MSDNCKTCGIFAGTHVCDPKNIRDMNARKTIQAQQSEITRLNNVIELDNSRFTFIQDHIDNAITRENIDKAISTMSKETEQFRNSDYDIGN